MPYCLQPKNIALFLLILFLGFLPVSEIKAYVPGCNGEVMYCVKDCTYGFKPPPKNACCTFNEYFYNLATCIQAPMVISGPLDCNSIGCANGLYLTCPPNARLVSNLGVGMCLRNCPPGQRLDPTGTIGARAAGAL